MTWAELFERASEYETSVTDVRTALEARRGDDD